MIQPSEIDIGRRVVYRARYPGAKPESGEISSFNAVVVHVLFKGDTNTKGCDRSDLEWEFPDADAK